jgi:mRNA-degrading endonuclease YafQ of YafQ-DinJ toxin-antitoxin module
LAADHGYQNLDFTDTFLQTFAAKDLSAADRTAFLKALRLLDNNEKHPSLRVHRLHGDREGSWSASASGSLRLTFERLAGGRKRLLTCSKHYNR